MEEQRFRGSWTPEIGSTSANSSGGGEKKMVMKLEYGGVVRLVEVGEPLTMEKMKSKFEELFGESVELKYSLPGDVDEILIKTDDELVLADRFGGKPLKIIGFSMPPKEDDLDVYEHASLSLKKNGVDDAAPQEIKQLLSLLQLRPRRLVKFGLAPPRSLKVDDDDDSDDDDDDDFVWEEVKPPVLSKKVEKLSIDDTVVVEAVSVEDDLEQHDVIVAAVKGPGGCANMSPSTIHALLRVLHVRPMRFVRLGLVPDISSARAAYKYGGKHAVKMLFKGDNKKHKGWGRGLCGGRGKGRGHGWTHEQQEPDKKKGKHFGHHNHFHGPHPFGGPPGTYDFGHHNTFHATPPHVSAQFFGGGQGQGEKEQQPPGDHFHDPHHHHHHGPPPHPRFRGHHRHD